MSDQYKSLNSHESEDAYISHMRNSNKTKRPNRPIAKQRDALVPREGEAEELITIKRDIQVLNDTFTKMRIKMTSNLNQYEQMITTYTNKRWAKQNQQAGPSGGGLIDPAFDK